MTREDKKYKLLWQGTVHISARKLGGCFLLDSLPCQFGQTTLERCYHFTFVSVFSRFRIIVIDPRPFVSEKKGIQPVSPDAAPIKVSSTAFS